MKPERNGTVVYALAGRSLEAALRLERELAKELQTVPVLQKGSLRDIGDSWDGMYKGLLARLEKDAPHVLTLTGLKSPAVQVFKGPQTLPGAYEEYPKIFSSPEKIPAYFLYAPVDYKGRHFVPADAVLLTDKESQNIDNRLFAGGWLGNAPIVSIKKQGVATPTDYVAPSETELRKAFSYAKNDHVTYLAAGRSLEIVEEYRARTREWERKIKAACRAIEAAAGKTKTEILLGLPAGEDVRISATYSYSSGGGDKATLLLSIRREGKNSIWDAGKTVDALPSPAFHLSNREGGEYIVTARTDTAEGKKLAALIDAIPLTPGLRDYPELYANFDIKHDQISRMLGVNGVVPQAVEVDGRTVLVYSISPKSKENGFCPPGAKPFPAEAYEWLRSNEGDRNMGITPPPMPKEIVDILSAADTALPTGKKRPHTPKPKR